MQDQFHFLRYAKVSSKLIYGFKNNKVLLKKLPKILFNNNFGKEYNNNLRFG